MSNPKPDTAPNPKAKLIAACIAGACVVAAPMASKWEGYAPKVYLDPVKIPTYCFGETENVDLTRIYSKDECGVLLRKRMARDYAPKIMACLPQLADERRVKVFGALLDASYNAGPVAVCKSAMAINVRAGNWRSACDAFPGWYVTARDRRTGVRVKLKGLVSRRLDEQRTCLGGIN